MILYFGLSALVALFGCGIGVVCAFKSTRALIINIGVTAALIIAWLAILVAQHQNATGNAKMVASIGDSKQDIIEIFYDNEKDEYFKIESSQWDVFDLYDRVTLDYELVEQYLETKSETYEMQLLEK